MECKNFGIGPEPHRAADTEHCLIQKDQQDSKPVGTSHYLI